MPGDPKKCRKHTARCAELAITARTPELRAKFLELSKIWEKLAIELDDTFDKLAETEDIMLSVRESLDGGRWLRKQ
jgi:hypothetical protein